MSLPCSSHVYQVTLTPERKATSSRRNPRSRRRATGGNPYSDRNACSRRARRNRPSSLRLSPTPFTEITLVLCYSCY